MKQFSENLKRIRKASGFTQADLGKNLGVSDKTVSSWEKGRTEPNMEMVENICKCLDCRKTDLMGWKTEDMFAGLSTFVMATADEQRILDSYRKADDQTKEMVRRILKG